MPSTVRCNQCMKEWDEAKTGDILKCPKHGAGYLMDLEKPSKKFLVITTYTVEIESADINTVEEAIEEARRIHDEDVDEANGLDKVYSISKSGKTLKLLA